MLIPHLFDTRTYTKKFADEIRTRWRIREIPIFSIFTPKKNFLSIHIVPYHCERVEFVIPSKMEFSFCVILKNDDEEEEVKEKNCFSFAWVKMADKNGINS